MEALGVFSSDIEAARVSHGIARRRYWVPAMAREEGYDGVGRVRRRHGGANRRQRCPVLSGGGDGEERKRGRERGDGFVFLGVGGKNIGKKPVDSKGMRGKKSADKKILAKHTVGRKRNSFLFL